MQDADRHLELYGYGTVHRKTLETQHLILRRWEDGDAEDLYYEDNTKSERVQEKCGFKYQWRSENVDVPLMLSIVSLYARVIYYPLGKDAPWGFTRISGSQNDAFLEKPFVAINSSIPVDCQVFAAAHELYHIWYEQNPDVLPADLLNRQSQEISEKRANRFAAEFLVDEQILKQEIDIYKIKRHTIKSILQLASLFSVPYRTMAKRLFEIDVISNADAEKLLAETEDAIEQYKKRYSIPSIKAEY